MSRNSVVAGFAALVAGLTLLSVPAPAAATPVAGENGRIVLTSGRNLGDAAAELFLLPVPFPGGGTISAPVASAAGQQHRHATWSPDRTKIAYARGPAGGPFDIFVLDLTVPGATPQNITQSAAFNEDRPAWAPNGTHIAWEQSDSAGAPTYRDVIVALTNGGGQTTVTAPFGAGFAGKPAWHPNGGTIFYEDGPGPFVAADTDINKRSVTFGPPITFGAELSAVADVGLEFQPYIAPSGDRLCYGQMTAGDFNSADLKVALLTTPVSQGTTIAPSAVADYNCTFSPDSTQIAYVNGAFGTGQLMLVEADGSEPPIPIAQDAGGNDFDGNPDWAPDGRPECPNSIVQATTGVPISIPVECLDTGPEYERSNVREFVGDGPTNGTTDQDSAGDPVTYTSNAGFVGIDSFEIRSFDGFGFATDRGTVTVQVVAPDPGADTTAPETIITKGPKAKSRLKPGKRKKKAKFLFASSEANSTFECSVDGAALAPCVSPFKVKVKRGRHTFAVQATDAAGNTDATPAEYKWRVKRPAQGS